jgi:hypothetical protein
MIDIDESDNDRWKQLTILDEFGDDKREEAQHCQSAVLVSSTGRERTNTASISRLAIHTLEGIFDFIVRVAMS